MLITFCKIIASRFFYVRYFYYISTVIKTINNMENIEYLSSRNKDLLLMGAKTTGSFLDGFDYVNESLYIDESDELYAFCEYIENEIGGAGPINIDMLWLGFKYPESEYFSNECAKIKKDMERINAYC